MGKLQPFFSVIVTKREKILVDEHPQSRTQASGQHQRRDAQQRGKYKRNLQGFTPAPPKAAHPVTGGRDHQQADPRKENCRRLKYESS